MITGQEQERNRRNEARNRAAETGALIRKLRRIHGLTQMGLAERMGVSYQQIQKYEYGRSELTISRLWQIAGALDVPVGTLVPGADGTVPEPMGLDEEDVRALGILRGLDARGLRQLAMRVLDAIAVESLKQDGGSEVSRP